MSAVDVTRWRGLVADMPLAVLDTETTDKDAKTATVCELGVMAFGSPEIEAAIAATYAEQRLVLPAPAWSAEWRFNPGQPIKAGATRTHGIRDEDVAGCPPIESIAPSLAGVAAGFRLVGFNSDAYDLPIMTRTAQLAPVHTLDVMGVAAAARREPGLSGYIAEGVPRPWDVGGPIALLGFPAFAKKLTSVWAALRGRAPEGAHKALVDCQLTADVLFLLVALYPGLPAVAADLAVVARQALCMVEKTPEGLVFVVGKHEGDLVSDVDLTDPSYLGWLLDPEEEIGLTTVEMVVEQLGEGRAAQLVADRRGRPARRGGGRPRKQKEQPADAAAAT